MSDNAMTTDTIKDMVRARYGDIAARADSSCCAPAATTSCCAPAAAPDLNTKARDIGYSDEELAAVPEGANLGLGCGNPLAIAAMKAGEVVVDLGSGAGFDCLLAARQVGATGRVIGIDMTHEMLKKARENAHKVGAANVEFRLGELEHLPIADDTADVIISNCVINLVPDKAQVFREAFRVLKPGGRRLSLGCRSISHRCPRICAPIPRCCAAASQVPFPPSAPKSCCVRQDLSR